MYSGKVVLRFSPAFLYRSNLMACFSSAAKQLMQHKLPWTDVAKHLSMLHVLSVNWGQKWQYGEAGKESLGWGKEEQGLVFVVLFNAAYSGSFTKMLFRDIGTGSHACD